MPSPAEIAAYMQRSGDESFKTCWPFHEYAGGWFSYFINPLENEFVICQAMGKHQDIAREARELANLLQCDRIIFATRRNGEAFARLTGAKVVATVLELPLEAGHE